MKARLRFAVAAGVLGLLMTGPFALTGLLLFAEAKEAERAAFSEFLAPRLPLAGLITLFGLIVGVLLLRGLFERYVHGLLRMAETLRLMLGAGIAETGTVPRLRRVVSEGVMTPADAQAAVHAFHALQGIRLAAQSAAGLDGPAAGNLLDPDRLNEFDRRVLLESLRQARKLQQKLKTRFHIET